MKIVYLTATANPESGGWGRLSYDIIHGLEKKGNEVTILKEQEDNFSGIKVLSGGYKIFQTSYTIRKYIKNCDIIHAFDGFPYGVMAALTNIGINKKLIITAVGTYSVSPLYHYRTKQLLTWSYKKADKIVSISNYTKDEIKKKLDLNEIEVIKPGIDFLKFNREKKQTKDPFLLSVGDIKYRKGYHVSVEAFARVKKIFKNLKYVIVGNQDEKEYFEYLKKKIVELKVEDDIKFISAISDDQLIDLYSQAKLFIMPSINYGHNFEGFGIVFLEAAAAGLPVIGSLGNGIPDAIKENYNGLLVPQNDPESTTEAILKILNDENYCNTLSKNSYAWAQANDIEKAAMEYDKIYKELMTK